MRERRKSEKVFLGSMTEAEVTVQNPRFRSYRIVKYGDPSMYQAVPPAAGIQIQMLGGWAGTGDGSRRLEIPDLEPIEAPDRYVIQGVGRRLINPVHSVDADTLKVAIQLGSDVLSDLSAVDNPMAREVESVYSRFVDCRVGVETIEKFKERAYLWVDRFGIPSRNALGLSNSLKESEVFVDDILWSAVRLYADHMLVSKGISTDIWESVTVRYSSYKVVPRSGVGNAKTRLRVELEDAFAAARYFYLVWSVFGDSSPDRVVDTCTACKKPFARVPGSKVKTCERPDCKTVRARIYKQTAIANQKAKEAQHGQH
jgi:hypothetical protein